MIEIGDDDFYNQEYIMKTFKCNMFLVFLCYCSFHIAAQNSINYDYGGLIAQVFQDNMVIQQGKPLILWGNAPKGERINIITDWAVPESTLADINGAWKLLIEVPKIMPGDYTSHSIEITTGSDTIKLKNILFGDVWFLSGQSNMSMSMKPFLPWHKGVINHEEEIKAADYPYIRLYRNEKHSSLTPNNISNGKWEICSSEAVADFSAVGYYMGRKIFQEVNIPIGIIVSALGGMSCQSFTPAETLQSNETLKKEFWQPYLEQPEMKETVKPAHLYNGMIHPFIKLSVRGFAWYQGESNASHKDFYTLLCSEMIKAWRKAFAQGDLPFYSVQMTPYSWKGRDYYGGNYAYFREAQEKINFICPNTDIISTMDVGEVDNIHPSDKKTIGERLAALALHYDYGFNGPYKGPKYDRMEIKKNRIILHFDKETIGTGLQTKDGKEPAHFYLAGADKIFHLAKAKIKGETVELISVKVKKPVAVRYAFLTYPITNFENKEGFAAYPFRTDQWSDIQYSENY